MTQEKELLLKDLSARLPYSIKCHYNNPEIDDDIPEGISVIKGFKNNGILVEIESGDIIDIDYIKPYLRPMSSMTEEEKSEYYDSIYDAKNDLEMSYLAIDWLNAHHFDYRGLISKGFALNAPEYMYK